MLRVPPLTAAAPAELPGAVLPVLPVDPVLHAVSPSPTAPMAATHVSALVFLVMRSLFRDGHECPLRRPHWEAA
ncbi:hypothetical protein GCM10009826_43040 [Humibacillus xanthopallidus]